MPLPDTLYCAQQIKIPPQLPDILKSFTKAAIRTQPNDLLQWSAAYFHALAKGECLPVKERLERNVGTGLTPGLLKILHKQMSSRPMCSREELQMKWKDLGLPMEQLKTLLSLGCFSSEFSWIEFFALGCTALGETLESSLKYACEILTNDEEGGPARIPFETFVQIYTFLARLEGDLSPQQIDNFLKSLEPQVAIQDGMIKPVNFINMNDMDSTPSSSTFLSSTTLEAE
ncbi:PREDICTED: ropporin-1-like protein isoform X1 [Cyprinodon variegatus]|uniref:ropporin-1-like protein isoform X1 n=1 Tax=Cyprinodon variegatus TaxID=28743 RepID=UPI00074268E2|nr:PREDICTED: ropporin-1-like protein isoform X1 [Cyprinodon variegatus]